MHTKKEKILPANDANGREWASKNNEAVFRANSCDRRVGLYGFVFIRVHSWLGPVLIYRIATESDFEINNKTDERKYRNRTSD